MRRAPEIACWTLVLAGCASPRPPIHGAVAVTLRAPSVDGRVAAGGGLSLDLLLDKWMASYRSEAQALPSSLDLGGSGRASYNSWEAAAGPKVFEGNGVRIDAWVGVRAQTLLVSDSPFGLVRGDADLRETWFAPITGLRAQIDLSETLSFRIRWDAAPGNSESDRAWRASAAFVLGFSRDAALSFGWERFSVHHDRGHGENRVLLDATLSGPFVALELRF